MMHKASFSALTPPETASKRKQTIHKSDVTSPSSSQQHKDIKQRYHLAKDLVPINTATLSLS